ncbi:CDP-glycerol--glycerophosphate glycerophosphotransferase [Lactobacillus melliventris]|uniref:CDP-glycerol glycerophosphotransferase family protein n=1 Tax=Lactobacillus melliventris TaxID=1218507 RepID=UPI0015812AED|nr:CDP-glycerol glycerophosphotransferase family protein [Lactobacillus melliventris]NUE98538.1 CDP-glycerol--glycerophosphate glycerophosphotransferase [Lactobacillus melliventris]
MKSFLFRLYLTAMKLIARFTPIQSNKVVVLNGAGRSGSNGYLFGKYLQKSHPEYEVTIVEPWPSSHLPLKTWRKIGAAKFVLTTHQPFKVHARQVNIQFWHGIPLKRMGFVANNTSSKVDLRNAKLWQKNADIVCSSSDLYESLMSACCGIESNKYHKTGFPRIDALKNPVISKKQLLSDLFKTQDDEAQIGIYMPTFRYEMEDNQIMDQVQQGNFLTLFDFNIEQLNNSLKKNHQYLIVKLHPYEMKLFKHLQSNYSNIVFLNNDYLYQQDIDLYELLGNTAFLITDFSSIYFDYLNIDKPIIFVTNYLRQYEEKRGLLMGPYEEIVPGICVKTQQELMQALTMPDQYSAKRRYWLKLTNQVQNQSSCANVVELLKSIRG